MNCYAPCLQVATAAAGMTGPQPTPVYQQPVPAAAGATGMQQQASAGLGSRPSSMGGAVPGLQVCGRVGGPWWMGGEGAGGGGIPAAEQELGAITGIG